MNNLLKLIISGLLLTCSLSAAQSQADSVIKKIQALPQDVIRLQKLLSWSQQTIDTPDEIIYLDALLQEAEKQNNIAYQDSAHRAKVCHYFNGTDLNEALLAYKPALSFFRKHKLFNSLFETEALLVTLYTDLEKFEYSLSKGLEMYKEAENLSNESGKISACYALAFANYASRRFREAIYWDQLGLSLLRNEEEKWCENLEFNFNLSECYHELGQTDSFKIHLDSVCQHVKKVESLHPEKPDTYLDFYWVWICCRYADYYLSRKKPDLAKKYLDEAGGYIKNSTYGLYVDLYYYCYSDYYLATGHYQQALEYLDEGFRHRSDTLSGEDPELIRKRAQIYYQMGNYPLAINEIQRSIQVADTLNNKRLTDQSKQLRSLYEVNRLQAEGKRQTYIIHVQMLLLLLLGLFIVLLGFSLFHFYKIKHQLAAAAKEADEANSNTSGFLNNMRREIQAFLQEISQLSDRLIHEPESEKRQEYADLLRSKNELAQHVIFDILDVSKIESDRMRFQYEEINLKGLVNEAYSMVQHTPDQQKQIRIASCEELLYKTDPQRLNQILVNLLRYATSHTTGTEIQIGYQKHKNGISFIIAGNGWVITEEEREKMFDRLVQTAGKLQEMKLEMIISRGLIIKMGGQMTVYTGTNTRFEFTLPNFPPEQNNLE